MNKEDPYRDQAERLRQRIDKINDSTEKKEILPPRGDLHRNVRKKTKWKLKFPVIRLLLITFILLLITIYSAYSYLGGKKIGNSKKSSAQTSGYETVNIDNSNTEKNGAQKNITSDKNDNQEDSSSLKDVSSKSDLGSELTSLSSTTETTGPDSDKNGSVDEKKNIRNVSSPSRNEEMKFTFHTVGHQETLYHIAMTYYHSSLGVEWIKQANNIKQDGIKEGQVLKIPVKK
ncbi:MAG: LysM domain-containing protein [Bacillota bacterium]|nr:LysM domain-containing protein [Bacillota bacterium]MDP4170190.1 LysM domain-containing protein [Bacillota bacterium]